MNREFNPIFDDEDSTCVGIIPIMLIDGQSCRAADWIRATFRNELGFLVASSMNKRKSFAPA